MSFPLSFCISPYPADWNIDVITGALATFLHHEDAGYTLGMTEPGSLGTSWN